MKVTDALLRDLETRLPMGRAEPYPAATLAADMEIDERTVRALVHELRCRGVLVGSACSANRTGYFIARTPEDLEAGTEHLRSRALSMLKPFHAMRRAAEAKFGDKPEVLQLFDLDEEAVCA